MHPFCVVHVTVHTVYMYKYPPPQVDSVHDRRLFAHLHAHGSLVERLAFHCQLEVHVGATAAWLCILCLMYSGTSE